MQRRRRHTPYSESASEIPESRARHRAREVSIGNRWRRSRHPLPRAPQGTMDDSLFLANSRRKTIAYIPVICPKSQNCTNAALIFFQRQTRSQYSVERFHRQTNDIAQRTLDEPDVWIVPLAYAVGA